VAIHSAATGRAGMRLVINGTARDVRTATLATLLTELLGDTRGSAAAVDGEVVPRAEWTGFALHEGQSIEVITAVQGG
jgi:sulfur carrier protein